MLLLQRIHSIRSEFSERCARVWASLPGFNEVTPFGVNSAARPATRPPPAHCFNEVTPFGVNSALAESRVTHSRYVLQRSHSIRSEFSDATTEMSRYVAGLQRSHSIRSEFSSAHSVASSFATRLQRSHSIRSEFSRGDRHRARQLDPRFNEVTPFGVNSARRWCWHPCGPPCFNEVTPFGVNSAPHLQPPDSPTVFAPLARTAGYRGCGAIAAAVTRPHFPLKSAC